LVLVSSMANRNLCIPLASLLALACLPACSTTAFKVGIAVDPPTAAVFVNGTRVGQGTRRVYDVDFGSSERICVQAAAPGFEPVTELLTKQQVQDQLSKYGDFRWTLKQEK
jgi:hypothetical protein